MWGFPQTDTNAPLLRMPLNNAPIPDPRALFKMNRHMTNTFGQYYFLHRLWKGTWMLGTFTWTQKGSWCKTQPGRSLHDSHMHYCTAHAWGHQCIHSQADTYMRPQHSPATSTRHSNQATDAEEPLIRILENDRSKASPLELSYLIICFISKISFQINYTSF